MRVKEISVADLFGIFNHRIPLNLEDRVTIVYGPNGFGKTVLLTMIHGLFRGAYSIFRSIPFGEFRVDLEDGGFMSVRQKREQQDGEESCELTIEGPGRKRFKPQATRPRDMRYFPASMIAELVPGLQRTGPREWLDVGTGQVLSRVDVLDRYGDSLPDVRRVRRQRTPEWLRNVQQAIDTHFVGTDRLLARRGSARARRAEPQVTQAVVRYSEELAQRIQQTLARSGALSQSLDRTFPSRLVSRLSDGTQPQLAEDRLRRELAQLEEKRKRLTEAGLIDRVRTVEMPEQVGDLARNVLSVYIQDVREKLNVFDELLEKIELIQKIINQRYLYKSVGISKEHGFVFQASDGQTLLPQALSSGEQHELVLIYELLFRVQPGSLILIDEPELSLHIAWQRQFLKDVADITRLSGIDVIIATHSPDIINDRWDLTVELGGPDA